MTPPGLLHDRTAKEERESLDLATFAMQSARSRGRRYEEQPDPLRTCFERDRDRILHSTAFRRLMYKTQVFVNSVGDHNRTRLSHSLEVCQVARSIGAALRVNGPLCEAVALAHDMGHPPFGHGGEESLNELMREFGGFRHNAHVLRVIDQLERRRPDHHGLNLTREVRESLLKHEADAAWPEELQPRPKQPLLEAQIVDLADSTAYNKHDVEDGLRADMFTEDELYEHVGLWRRSCALVDATHPGFRQSTRDSNLKISRIANELIGTCILDITNASAERLRATPLADSAAVQGHTRRLIAHGDELAPLVAELQSFLHSRFYQHASLQLFRRRARHILSTLFKCYRDMEHEMPSWYREWAQEVGLERAICDYLAGMTDRFALSECQRLTGEQVAMGLEDEEQD